MRIRPAELAFDASGTPISRMYGDVYHSADSGPGQARHVFIRGNDLPDRWAGARVFTILETGFGFGLNFLATRQAWRDDPQRPERLHFVSIEKHPFERDALQALHARYDEFAALASQLHAAWPPLVPGLHRLHFEDERVTLTLALGDVNDVVPKLRLTADAIYLDGFSPQVNAEMWSQQIIKQLARLARPGTTFATWSTAGAVRESLARAGFELAKRPGFGHKREMLAGRYAPRWPVRQLPAAASGPEGSERHAIVIGAGVAGAAVSERLSRRGWRIDLLETRRAAEIGKPDRFAGVFHPHVSRDDCLLSRLARAGFLYALSRWTALEQAGHVLAWSRCGLLQLANNRDEAWSAGTITALGYPADYAAYVDRAEAARLAGIDLPTGGWWFPDGGWVRPHSLVAAQLASSPTLTVHPGACVQSIARVNGTWRALDADGKVIAAAPALVLANAADAARLASFAQPLDRVRGQITYVPAEHITAPRSVVTGGGYVLPASDGIVVTGATYEHSDDAEPNAWGHEANLMRVSAMLPGALRPLDASRLAGAVGFRAVALDRLPLAGAVPDVDAIRGGQSQLAGAQLRDLPREPGLYCAAAFASRGLVWAALAGELLASLLEGEPLPLEGDLADAVDPGRFVLRKLRSGRL